MENFSHTLRELRKNLGLTQTEMADKLGLSLSYIHQLEHEKRTPSANIVRLVEMIKEKQDAYYDGGYLSEPEAEYLVNVKPTKSGKCRMVPVIGMAHAGHVVDYDEIEETAQEYVPTLCQDELAHGINIEGDSMYPKVKHLDCVIVSPSERPYNGCIVIARLSGEGVVCRTVESLGGKVRLVPQNERYEVTVHDEQDFDWMYVVYGTWSQFWRD